MDRSVGLKDRKHHTIPTFIIRTPLWCSTHMDLSFSEMSRLLVNKRFGLSPRTPLFPNASQKDNGTRTGEKRPLKYFRHIRDCTSLEFWDSAFLLIHFNRQEILYQYYAYAFHGSAVSIFWQSVVSSGHLMAAREKAPGAEIVSGIVTGDTPVSYWPIFLPCP